MSATGRPAGGVADAESAAAVLSESGFVRVVSRADGDGLAAAGVLARALDSVGVPFQVRVARTATAAVDAFASADEDTTTVALGVAVEGDVVFESGPVVRQSAALARELGDTPSEPLVLAGLRSAGVVPTEDDGSLSRRPGVGVPTADLADGLAHSTLVRGAFSGDESRAGATLAELELPADVDDAAHRRLASVVALGSTVGPAPARAADALFRALHPHVHPDCEFATVEGFGDVLDALARSAPGLGVATALGGLDRTDALDAWREHGVAVHAAVSRADVTESNGVATTAVSDVDSVAVARLLRDFVTDAPMVFVGGDGDAALATTDADARATLDAAGAGAVGGTGTLAYATTDDVDALEAGVRGAA